MSVSIHPSALVSAGARLGKDVVIGPYACIDDEVEIGDGTRVDAFACVRRHTRLGGGNHIFSYAMVGEIPQDLKFSGEHSRLEIGDGNKIREFSTLHRGTGEGGVTRVGSGCLLMAYTHIAHDCILGSHVVMANNATLAGHVEVQDHATVGGLSAVHQFTRVGRYAFVGGMSGIGQDVPPYMLASGARASLFGPNLVGLRRLGFSAGTIEAIRAAYRIIWRSGLLRREALQRVAQEYAAFPEVMEIVEFVNGSERSVLGADRSSGS